MISETFKITSPYNCRIQKNFLMKDRPYRISVVVQGRFYERRTFQAMQK